VGRTRLLLSTYYLELVILLDQFVDEEQTPQMERAPRRAKKINCIISPQGHEVEMNGGGGSGENNTETENEREMHGHIDSTKKARLRGPSHNSQTSIPKSTSIPKGLKTCRHKGN
jgi:hypothetical protein